MSINAIIDSELFETYRGISHAVKSIKKTDKTMDEKKNLMTELRKENEAVLKYYNDAAGSFARSFLNENQLKSDHIIEARIGSPTPYGNQPKDYLWSGISIHEDKSFSFQYSWVFQKDLLEVTFCFGSGGSSNGRINATVKEKKEAQIKSIEKQFINILSVDEYRAIILRLLEEEGFVITKEWLNSEEKLPHIESYVYYIRTKTSSKTGITKLFKPDQLMEKGFDLESELHRYFHLFRPIWERLHLEIEETDINDDNIEKEELHQKQEDNQISGMLKRIKHYIAHQGFQYPYNLIENFYLSLKTKPFVILAGISGTGKTKLIQKFAEALGATEANAQFTLIPVRPDWNDPSDLIGYKDLGGTFRRGKLTYVLESASEPENWQKPYFVCLDEMNLARVEHYFSDLLSILETQRWQDGHIVTDKIVTEDQVGSNFCIPENVFFIGTVNMDETTHPFSKKVLDRANTIEFNHIQLDSFYGLEDIVGITEEESEAVYPAASFLTSDYLQLKDAYINNKDIVQRTVGQLVRINTILENIHAHVGFRVRDSICFYLIYNERFSLMTTDEAMDMQIMQKILPRIQGNNSVVKKVIIELLLLCITGSTVQSKEYLDGERDVEQLWTKQVTENNAKYPQSSRKLIYMLRRLYDDGYTSFWVS
ncbi:AAA family ATPase [Paenibacillus sp. FSL H8-0537]|uniref:McrB family protein n=1 Tax=Paenibacillus sp. FSL H8-0537 TaxID=2921399 RepID=UPI003101B3BF